MNPIAFFRGLFRDKTKPILAIKPKPKIEGAFGKRHKSGQHGRWTVYGKAMWIVSDRNRPVNVIDPALLGKGNHFVQGGGL